MTVSRELLMRYHDGEVSDEELRVVEAALEQQPALQAELEAYTQLGSFLRAWGDGPSHQSEMADVADSVMRAIEPPKASVHSLLPRVATWISLGAAIAAGSVLVVRSWSASQPSSHSPVSSSGGSARVAAPNSAAAEESSALLGEEEPKPPPATIESVDFGANPGTVFVVSTESSETPVVWLPEEADAEENDEDRTESL